MAAVEAPLVELGESRSGTLRDELARALGDPTLEVAYWAGERGAYVDEAGATPLAEVLLAAVSDVRRKSRRFIETWAASSSSIMKPLAWTVSMTAFSS